MKILCPLDFSETSVNAIKYAGSLFGLGEAGEIEIVHCVNVSRRAMMFVKLDDMLKEKAEEDLKILLGKMEDHFPNLTVSTKIVSADPKYFLPKYAEQKGFDFVVVGTSGMTQLKDLTIGSLTEALFENCNVPVLAIPNDLEHIDNESVVLALDDEAIAKEGLLMPLKKILTLDMAKIHLCHVKEKGDDAMEYDPAVDVMLHGFEYDYNALDLHEKGIEHTIHEFADSVKADMLVFIHHKRSWWERIFKSSHTKEELYSIKTPLLVIQG